MGVALFSVRAYEIHNYDTQKTTKPNRIIHFVSGEILFNLY